MYFICKIKNKKTMMNLMRNLSYFLEHGNMTEELVFLNEYNELCMSTRTLLLGCDYSLCTCEMKEVML
jgi:hypothetical protein